MKIYKLMQAGIHASLYCISLFLLALPHQHLGAQTVHSNIISIQDIQNLPAPVQRFLNYSGVIGTPMISQAIVTQTGRFKIAPDKSWVPFTAEQIYNIDQASFEWKVRMKMAPLMIVKGEDRLEDGRGSMKIKLFGIIPLVNARGPEIDQGAMTRYLSEAIWFPQAFVDEQITWESIDSLSAKAIFTIAEKSVEGIFHFDQEGKVTLFECERYATEGKDMVLRHWRTPIDEYGERSGLLLSTRGRAIWDMGDSDYCYVDVEIMEVSYK